MRIEELKDTCTACGACISECPEQCIEFVVDEEGFYFPQINKDKCISCFKCERVCQCLSKNSIPYERRSYYGFSTDPEIRAKSTSGGVFATLAQQILKENGNVYGSAFDFNEVRLLHKSTDEVPLDALLKSKYIESYMGDTIAKIKRDLNNNRKVLFCGTPCQAAGVRKVIDADDNLLICDFICHGVPSAEIFRTYMIKKLKKSERLTALDFRPKDLGWNSKNIRLITTTTTTTTPYFLDVFYKGFMSDNAFLRRSCYDCQHRSMHSSDITIADFWGYRALDPSLNDGLGLSLIVAHSEKGKIAVESMEQFELHQMDNQYSDYAFEARDYSGYLRTRKHFYEVYKNGDLKKAAKKTYMKDYHLRWAKYWIKKLLNKI